MAIVYQHKRNDTGEIFYIGIGTRKDRANSKASRSDWWNAIESKYGRTVEVLFEDVDIQQAKFIEKYLISYYGRKDSTTWGQLVNMTDGADGCYNHSNEVRKKMGEKNIGRQSWNKGHKWSQEVKDKMSKAKLGKPKQLKSIVVQYSKEGVKLNTYRIAAEAAKATGISRTAIECCISNISKTSGGYIWRRQLTLENPPKS